MYYQLVFKGSFCQIEGQNVWQVDGQSFCQIWGTKLLPDMRDKAFARYEGQSFCQIWRTKLLPGWGSVKGHLLLLPFVPLTFTKQSFYIPLHNKGVHFCSICSQRASQVDVIYQYLLVDNQNTKYILFDVVINIHVDIYFCLLL